MSNEPTMGANPTGPDAAGAVDAAQGARGWGRHRATLVLADGETFRGITFGARPDGDLTTGLFTFSTVMSGYQQVISDETSAGHIIVFTYPQIGAVGTNSADDNGHARGCRGVVLRDLSRIMSNWLAEEDLETYLSRNGIPGLAGVDTRRLVRHLRDHGPLSGAFGTAEPDVLLDAARSVSAATAGTADV